MTALLFKISALFAISVVRPAPEPPPVHPGTPYMLTYSRAAVSASSSIPDGEVRRAVTLTGELHVYDTTGLAGVSHGLHIEHVEDPEGRIIYAGPRTMPRHLQRHLFNPVSCIVGGKPSAVATINLTGVFPLTDTPPKSLKRVVARVDTLRGPVLKEITLSLEPREDWTDLDDEVSIRISDVAQDDAQLQVMILIKGRDAAARLSSPQRQSSLPAPGASLRRVVFVDEHGKDSFDLHGRWVVPDAQAAEADEPLSTFYLTVTVPPGTRYTSLRMELAELIIESMRFELHDVQLPHAVTAQ